MNREDLKFMRNLDEPLQQDPARKASLAAVWVDNLKGGQKRNIFFA